MNTLGFSCLMLGSASAFMAGAPLPKVASTGSQVKMMAAKSKSLPFAPQPAALNGSLAGDVGFDPLGLSDISFDFSRVIVPNAASMRTSSNKVDTVYWMREAELKHGRIAMLAIVGWLANENNFHFPGLKYEGLTPLTAHAAMVDSGNMTVMLHFIMVLELIGGAAIFAAAKGYDRKAGDFKFDPLRFSKDEKSAARFALSEVKHARLAMLAFGGIATQAVITQHEFPWLF